MDDDLRFPVLDKTTGNRKGLTDERMMGGRDEDPLVITTIQPRSMLAMVASDTNNTRS